MDFDSFGRAIKLDHPLEFKQYVEVVGSCNGLLCLCETEDQPIVLWNPSTRKHQKLPVALIQVPRELRVAQLTSDFCVFFTVYGFGFDSVSDDYKLVRIVQFCGFNDDLFYSEVKVYSLKSNSWRRIQCFPYYLRYERVNAAVVGGVLHWVVSRKPKSEMANLIAAFDLGVEEYRLVPLSDYLDREFHKTLNNYFRINVRVLGGCLCVICHYAVEDRDDIWVMKDYGVKESWAKLLSVELQNVLRPFDSVRPLVYSKSGGEVLLAHDNFRLLWFDLKRKTVKHDWIHGVRITFEAEICLGSLVPLPGDGGCDGKKQQAQKKKDRKGRGCSRSGLFLCASLVFMAFPSRGRRCGCPRRLLGWPFLCGLQLGVRF
ncbi:F-box protein CPR1-like isoform X2 [Cornus florida]|uniref:F-box protein CPR1-like isoform X2 n=1 Tax=Cornus florida TaxID=4283 RepID=UPI00289FDCFD|nr:F-box protein CPR1-like isoform X2 [Cornus florida]